MAHKFIKFGDFIERFKQMDKEGVLCMPKTGAWTRDTEALIIDDEFGIEEFADEINGEVRILAEQGMEETLDMDTIDEVITNLDLQGGSLDFESVCTALQHYHANDAFIDLKSDAV